MLTKYKDVRRSGPEKNVNKPFENVSCQGHTPDFFRGDTHLWWHF